MVLPLRQAWHRLVFFDFTIVGLAVFTVGLISLLFLVRFLPDNGRNDQEVVPFYVEGKIQAGSKLIGKSVEQNGLRDLKDLFLAEILRAEQRIVAVSPKEVLQQGDVLLFVGDIKSVPLLTQFDGLKVVHDKHEMTIEHLVEVVVSHSSKNIGKTLKEARFREQFNAAVIAIRRGHDRLQGGLGKIRLQAGDSLILAPSPSFYDVPDLKREFVYISGLDLQSHLNDKKIVCCACQFCSDSRPWYRRHSAISQRFVGFTDCLLTLRYCSSQRSKTSFSARTFSGSRQRYWPC